MFSVTERIKRCRSQQQASRSSSEKLCAATDGECVFAFAKGHERWGGETSLWMNQSACWSAQHLLDPAGTRRRARGESHQHGFGGGHLTWRSCRTRKLQQILLCSQPWGTKRCDNPFRTSFLSSCSLQVWTWPMWERAYFWVCDKHSRSWGGLRVDEQSK